MRAVKKGDLAISKIVTWVLLLALLIWALIFYSGIRDSIVGLFDGIFGG